VADGELVHRGRIRQVPHPQDELVATRRQRDPTEHALAAFTSFPIVPPPQSDDRAARKCRVAGVGHLRRQNSSLPHLKRLVAQRHRGVGIHRQRDHELEHILAGMWGELLPPSHLSGGEVPEDDQFARRHSATRTAGEGQPAVLRHDDVMQR
jgi:hypothetical protein